MATACSAPSADGKWSVALTPEDTGVPWSRLPQRAASANESAEEHDPKGTPDRMADGRKEAGAADGRDMRATTIEKQI